MTDNAPPELLAQINEALRNVAPVVVDYRMWDLADERANVPALVEKAERTILEKVQTFNRMTISSNFLFQQATSANFTIKRRFEEDDEASLLLQQIDRQLEMLRKKTKPQY